jgi:type II restriction/modification system DNA methylase subunit YeeA
MNKAKLKSYAPQARKDFIAAVTARANLLGLSEKAGKLEVITSRPQGDVTVIAGQAWPVKVHRQREQLISRIQKDGFAQTMEAVAYTWFNRFAALRYMELHGYLSHGHRALSGTGGTLPDILTHATDLSHNGDLPGLNPALVAEMKLAGNRDGELYCMLLVAQCNALNNVMPFLFERIDDETELLLPDNLLRTDSVIAKLVSSIAEEDWKEVEIIGWLYQFYISERKDEVIGKVVKSEDIPAATQLFTPNWIVRYLVHNSIGRLWLMANPHSTLKTQWQYYIDPASQTLEAQSQLDALIKTRMNEDGGSIHPESITFMDPACGSGHILVEAYEVLKAIYLERGYQPRSVPRLILEKNLYGIDIDDRAAQMAGFALLMKARADDRRLFNEPVKLNVLAMRESKGLDANELARSLLTLAQNGSLQIAASSAGNGISFEDTHPQISQSLGLGTNSATNFWHSTIVALISTFTHAKTFGSLIQIPQSINAHLDSIAELLQSGLQSSDLYAKAAVQDLLPLVAQAKLLGMQYDAVVANPPYIGGKGMTQQVKDYATANFPDSKSDVFAMFIERCHALGKPTAELGFVTPYVWMFISSYEPIRKKLLSNATIQSLIQLEYNAFEPACVPVCAFTVGKSHVKGFVGSYIKLSDFKGHENQAPRTLEAINNPGCSWFHTSKPDDFKKIPGWPIAYWLSNRALAAFEELPSMSEKYEFRQGLATGSNAKFLRYWHECDLNQIGFGMLNAADAKNSGKRWFPCHKGGESRKWYGNQYFVVDWRNDGEALKSFPGSVIRNPSYYFRPGVTWGSLTISSLTMRHAPPGFIFESKGAVAFAKSGSDLNLLLTLANSKVMDHYLKVLAPTMDYSQGPLGKVPLNENCAAVVRSNAEEAIDIAKKAWDSNEISWDFQSMPLTAALHKESTLEKSWKSWAVHAVNQVSRMKAIEEENNKHFISAYGLQDELSNEVLDSEITLARADREKDCQRLISYAIGCMMGRYSVASPGLIYAHAGNIGFDFSRYGAFPADADGIVPLTDELWFQDDAASRIREFLLTVWGADTLAENMVWLAESVGAKANETPDETVRRYLSDKFYKDHLQTYKKRPIYWLFSSGKQGAFQALVYLHRYHEGTLARLRGEYVVPLTGKIQSRIEILQKDAAAAASTAARNKLFKEVETLKKKHVELMAYDEQLRHYADMRITLDLDEGIKVNYAKFGDLLADVKAITGGASDD